MKKVLMEILLSLQNNFDIEITISKDCIKAEVKDKNTFWFYYEDPFEDIDDRLKMLKIELNDHKEESKEA
jgi:hypothetical protein